MATDQEQITLKVFVNKTKNCVAFVESELDFVDVLLSFLTLPVGTVIRLLNKQSSLGCFDKLYQGVEQLDEKYFATAACRSMLTNPVNSSGVKCQDLKINIDEIGEMYTCLKNNCFRRSFSYYSGLKCGCGRDINKAVSYDLDLDYVNYEEFYGVFVEGANKFVVTDALWVESIEHSMLSTVDLSGLEERCMRIERAQVLLILKRSIISDTPLTDVLLCNGGDISPKFLVPPVEKTVAIKAFDNSIYRITLALIGNKVLYAGATQDFVNEIFSFLTFPLGTLWKQLGSRCRIGCLNNLYDSATQSVNLGYNMVTGCEERLVNPKLPPYFNCRNRVLRVEVEEEEVYYSCDYRCRLSLKNYSCNTIGHLGAVAKQALLIDPKTSPHGLPFSNGSFCKDSTYMVSNELVVTPFSFASVLSFHRQTSEPVKMVELDIGEEEVLDLLSAASSSKAALTDALFARANGVLTSVDGKAK